MVTKNNEQIVLNLIKTYDNIINKLYNTYPNKIEPLKHSWELSFIKYKQVIENDNVPLSKLKNGLSQGLCEIPFILQSILTTEEFNFAYDIYKDEIKNTEAKEIINNLFYKKYSNIIKKEKNK